MYDIQYLPLAEEDLKEITAYIAETLAAPGAALDLLDAFEKTIQTLAKFPYSRKLYTSIKALSNEYRMLQVKNYAVFYIVREPEKIVEIHRVLYAGMDTNRVLSVVSRD